MHGLYHTTLLVSAALSVAASSELTGRVCVSNAKGEHLGYIGREYYEVGFYTLVKYLVPALKVKFLLPQTENDGITLESENGPDPEMPYLAFINGPGFALGPNGRRLSYTILGASPKATPSDSPPYNSTSSIPWYGERELETGIWQYNEFEHILVPKWVSKTGKREESAVFYSGEEYFGLTAESLVGSELEQVSFSLCQKQGDQGPVNGRLWDMHQRVYPYYRTGGDKSD